MRLPSWTAACVFVLLIAAAPAPAATITIDFESTTGGALEPGTVASQGVRFGEWYEGRPTGSGWGLIDSGPQHQAASGTRLATDDYRRGGGEFPCNPSPPEHQAPALFGRLTSLATGLSVKVGTSGSPMLSGRAHLRAYNGGGEVVFDDSTGSVTHERAGTLLQGSAPGGEAVIAFFEVTLPEQVGGTQCQDLLLDDLSVTKPDVETPGLALKYVGPDPDPNPLLKDPAVVGLRPGVVEKGRIVVTEYGEVGDVDVSIRDEPPTVDATVGSVGIGGTFPLTLTASPKVENERVEVLVRAVGETASRPVTATLRIPVRTARRWVLDAPETANVLGCGSEVAIPLAMPNSLTFPGPGDDGLITVPAPDAPPVTATASAGTITKTQDGFTLATPPTSEPVAVQVTGDDGSANPHVVSIDVVPAEPTITGVSPTAGRTPQLLQPGTEVTITGAGLCPGAVISFGNDKALAPATVAPDGRSLTVRVPRLATTGDIKLAGSSARWPAAGTPGEFVVDSFRNRNGYSWENPFLDDLEFEDTERLYGYDQTHYESVDNALNVGCEFFTLGQADCDVKVAPASIEALLWHFIADVALSGDPGDGHCFGMSVTSRWFLNGKLRLTDFDPAARSIFDLQGPGAKQSPLRRYVRAQHMGQLSAEFIHIFLGYYTNAEINHTGEVVDRLKSYMNKGIAPVIAMNEGGGGHVVVAYDIEEGPTPGVYYVHVWDNNLPFQSSEDAQVQDRSGDWHQTRMHQSRIILDADDRWRYPALNYGPGEYDGSNHRLMIFDGGALKQQPTLPASLDGLIHMAIGASATTEKAGGRQSVPYSLFDAAPTSGAIFAKGSRPVVRRIKPTEKRGGYLTYAAGDGFSAAVKATDAKPGQTDTLTLDPRDTAIRLATGARQRKFELAVIGTDMGKTDRGLILEGSTRRGALTVRLTRRGAVVRAGAPARITPVLLGQVKGGAGVRRLKLVNLARGATLEVVPNEWAKPRGALRLRMKSPGGRTKTRRVRPAR